LGKKLKTSKTNATKAEAWLKSRERERKRERIKHLGINLINEMK
jgi:hypothetical protein